MRTFLLPYLSGSYVNYIDPHFPDWAHAYYGENLPRLQHVKAAYDPTCVFNFSQAIQPHSGCVA
jgi:FAD/FMN-containing dehydrogenase